MRRFLMGRIIFFVIALFIISGCSAGRMNQFDQAAATAHSEMQQAAVTAILAHATTPLCKVSFQPGVAVTGLTDIVCSAPTDYAKMMSILTQYNSPDGAREIMAKAFGDVAKTAIFVGGGAYLGGKAMDTMSYLGATGIVAAGNAAGTKINLTGNNNGVNYVGPTNVTAGSGGAGGATPGGAAPSVSVAGITDSSNRTHAPTIMEPRDPVIVQPAAPIIVQPSYPPVTP